ncbi:hypothetical protein G3570_03280 [Balneolaceae bacterium YR4-1]|uniref:CARDB domain-containing protein n=1 Tax=Halalkalibaculum roseum TaxID=2709311 RepID=A0A6M1SU53_9BACT|nr:CARDB domain-containing protein [Halalkalibaculum roseum]NGP75638.1 hypothetical protein [Halalkalibaculum roseum]
MEKFTFILFATLAIASCDLLYNQDSDSSAPLNDISISAIETTSFAKQGEIITVGITVTNSGTSTIDEEFEILLNNQSEGVTIGSKFLDTGLAPKDSVRVSYSWNTGNVAPGTKTLVAKHTFEDDNPANDSLQSTVTVNEPDITDIAVTDVRLPDTIEEGKVVDVEVDVKNIGNQDVNETITITLDDLADGKTIGTQKIDGGLAIGDFTTFTYSWDTQGYSIGDHQLSASHDFADENTDNDTRKASVTINEAPITDIAVISLEAPSEATQGDNVQVKAKIENLGNQDVGDAIKITLVDQNDGTTIDSKSISGGLATGAATSVTFNWNTDGASTGKHKLEVRHVLSDDISKNDSKSIEIVIIEAIYLDIAITTIKAPDNVETDQKVTIEVTLQNLGNRDVNENIMVTLANQTENKNISVETLKGGLKIGSSKTLKFEWNTKRAREGNHTLTVSHNFADHNLTNNSRTFEIEVEDD